MAPPKGLTMGLIEGKFITGRVASTGLRKTLQYEAFDYIIATREDLERITTPVGGVFTLPSGSYAFIAPVQFDDNDQLDINTAVYLQGMTEGDGIICNSTGVLLNIGAAASLDMVGMTANNTNAVSGSVAASQSTVRAERCTLNSQSTGAETIEITSGTWNGLNNTYSSPNFRAADHIAGDWTEIGSSFSAPTTCINNGSGAGVLSFTDCSVTAGQNGFRLRGARAEFINCLISCTGDGNSGLQMLGCSELVVIGGRFTASAAGSGISGIHYVSGGNVGSQLVGCTFDTVDIGVRHTDAAGAYGSFTANGVRMATSVTVGISWQNGDFPDSGMALVGCAILGATPFQNFTNADANIKAVLGALGSVPETPIVV